MPVRTVVPEPGAGRPFVEHLAGLGTAGDKLGARSLNVGDDQVQVLGRTGAAEVMPVPNWIEQSEPGGVSWTMRKVSPAARSASSLQPRPP